MDNTMTVERNGTAAATSTAAPYYFISGVAKIVGCHKRTLRRWLMAGLIAPDMHIGGANPAGVFSHQYVMDRLDAMRRGRPGMVKWNAEHPDAAPKPAAVNATARFNGADFRDPDAVPAFAPAMFPDHNSADGTAHWVRDGHHIIQTTDGVVTTQPTNKK